MRRASTTNGPPGTPPDSPDSRSSSIDINNHLARLDLGDGTIWPSEKVSKRSRVGYFGQYKSMHHRSVQRPDAFWNEMASELFWLDDVEESESSWSFDEAAPKNEWFKGIRTNVCYNCLDRNMEAGLEHRTALIFEANDPKHSQKYTYAELLFEVDALAKTMLAYGVQPGDRVVIYAPMIPVLPISMLACARIGAVHSVVFAGFSAASLAQRIKDCQPKLVITASASRRGTKLIPLKKIVDEALSLCDGDGVRVDKVIVQHNTDIKMEVVNMEDERDVWYYVATKDFRYDKKSAPIHWSDGTDPLFILYTSGSTGKPKGIVHSVGGYMTYVYTTSKFVFELQKGETMFCTADLGWITGHSYLLYGPLLNGASTVLFEGMPTFPDPGIWWRLVDKYKVSVFYTSPTALRTLRAFGENPVKASSRHSLKILGSVGEPIDIETWNWYRATVGDDSLPVLDTWWQTETGGHVITPLPGATPLKAGSATFPFFGIVPAIIDPSDGSVIEGEGEGCLCFSTGWPGLMQGVYRDEERYRSFFSTFKGYYFSGDGARRDSDGFLFITGRLDDVMNVSGHRIGTAEVESALALHERCLEAAVVGIDHEVKGQSIVAFCVLDKTARRFSKDDNAKELVTNVRKEIGPFAAPSRIIVVESLPKTRSGKIMRRILRKIAAGKTEDFGDTSTLADPSVIRDIIRAATSTR
jgi:acetyl-CoA synthetase